MGGGKGGNFGRTKGREKKIYSESSKNSALRNIDKLPKKIQKGVKSFFKGSSNNYNSYTILSNSDGTYTVIMTNPGRVPGSKAIYYKFIDSNGKTLRVYKESYDPYGNLIHRKEK